MYGIINKAFEEDKKRFIAAGMNGYLSKPFKEIELVGMVAKLLATSIENKDTIDQKNLPLVLYNLGKLASIANNNEQFMGEMIALFIQDSEDALQKIIEAQKGGNYRVIKKLVHKIKPSLDVMGIVSIAKEVRQIEETSLDDIDNNLFNQLINTILAVLQEAISQIKSKILLQN